MENTNRPTILLYSDGGAEPNPGPGGFGVILQYKGIKKEFSQGYQLTTNNRMELLGVIHGLKQLKVDADVQVYSDSKYVVEAMNKGWVQRWAVNNWNRSKNQKASNVDLWEELMMLSEKHNLTFHWIKGHNGHPENERCDELAGLAINGNDLINDQGYLWALENPIVVQKVKLADDPCKKCQTPVIKVNSKRNKIKPGQKYFFDFYLKCPNCHTTYSTEEAKREIKSNQADLFDI